MAMSDCVKCWETPCSCGHDWNKRSFEYLIKTRNMLDKVIQEKMPSDGDALASTGKDIRADNQ